MKAPLARALAQGGGRVPTVEEAAATLAEIAARPEFQPPEKGRLEELRERFAAWRDDLLRRVLEWLGLDGDLAEGLGLWVGYLALALLVVATIWIAARLIRSRLAAGPRGLSPSGERGAPAVEDPAARLLAEATAHARAGDYRRALGALYAGAVHALDRRGSLRFEEHKTAREYGRELSGDAREHWRRLVSAFEPEVYGDRGDGRAAWEAARAAADALGVGR